MKVEIPWEQSLRLRRLQRQSFRREAIRYGYRVHLVRHTGLWVLTRGERENLYYVSRVPVLTGDEGCVRAHFREHPREYPYEVHQRKLQQRRKQRQRWKQRERRERLSL